MNREIIILIVLGCMTWILYVMQKRCKHRTVKLGTCTFVLLYISGYLVITIFSRVPMDDLPVNLLPLKTYVGMYQTICYAKQTGNSVLSTIFSKDFAINGIIQNSLLYYPLGYLLPILFPKLKPKHVILIGCLCSIATEATQYLLKMGWCETDDVIHNTLGTAIGVWIWHLQFRRLNKHSEKD